MSGSPHSNRMREVREAQSHVLSLRELASVTGIDFNTLGRFERGDQALDITRGRKIAKALGVRLSALLLPEDMELQVDDKAREVLHELSEIPQEHLPAYISAARAMVETARRMAAQRSAGALAGDGRLVGALAERWNAFDDSGREKLLQLMDFSLGHRNG